MASLNNCQFIGNLGRDPEMKHLPGGDAVVNFSIACTETWKDKNTGEKKEATEWVRITAFGKLAEVCGKWLKKGSQVYVSGKQKTRKWVNKDGVDQYTTEIHIDEMKMLGGKPAEGSGQAAAPQQRQAAAPAARQQSPAKQPDFDDDIPF
jgi:single-strand DNA-binding protein